MTQYFYSKDCEQTYLRTQAKWRHKYFQSAAIATFDMCAGSFKVS